MITTDSKNSRDVIAALPFKEQGLMLALTVIGQRIRDLPREDREDMYELTKAFINAEDEEERDNAGLALFEILEQAPGTTKIFEAPTTVESLRSWTSFVASRIKEQRTKAGMTQEDLAKNAGLAQSHISRLEAGQHSPNGLTVQKIAKALGIPASALDPNAPKED